MIAKLIIKITRFNDRRVAEKELSKLSDHILNDIGICRGNIPEIVNSI